MKNIKFIDIKNILEKNSLEVISKISSNEIFNEIKTLANSTENDITFFSNKKYLNDLKKTGAKACFIQKEYAIYLPQNCLPIIVEDPYFALALISSLFNNESIQSNGIISKNSIINSSSKFSKNIQINSFTTVYENVEIGANVYIGSNCSIGPNVVIGKNVVISNNVSVVNSIIEEGCVIKSGARIGETGFGFEMKTKQKITHSGNVIIGKHSSIGSNTTIDRAVFDSTILGEYSNIDNLVQIAHNVNIGNFAVIAAQVGIAGSTKIGDNVKIGGQSGISGHLLIGDNVTIAGKSGVTKNIPSNKIVAGFPAKDISLWKKEIIKNSLKK